MNECDFIIEKERIRVAIVLRLTHEMKPPLCLLWPFGASMLRILIPYSFYAHQIYAVSLEVRSIVWMCAFVCV